MAHYSIGLANTFIDLASAEGRKLTPMQVMKLVYIAHGWSLALLDKPLLEDPTEAWKYGPVIPRLYHEIKHYGRDPIDEKIEMFDSTPMAELDANEEDLVKQVYDKYGHLNGVQLSHLTHKEGTAWHSTFENGARGVIIPDSVTQAHYKSLIPA